MARAGESFREACFGGGSGSLARVTARHSFCGLDLFTRVLIVFFPHMKPLWNGYFFFGCQQGTESLGRAVKTLKLLSGHTKRPLQVCPPIEQVLGEYSLS